MKFRKAVIVLVAASLLAMFTACSSGDVVKEISKLSKVDFSWGAVEQEEDSHGGFHGDGRTFVQIKYENERNKEIIEELEASEKWSKLPLSTNLSALVYGSSSDRANIGPYVTSSEGKALFPPVDNGYYFFMDRHNDSKDHKDDSEVLSRGSMNFTIAIYDTDNGMLYYYELDT